MRYCKKCGTVNLYDALFCSFCGQALPIDLHSAEREMKLLRALEADTPAEARPANPVELIDGFLAEENHRRVKTVFSLSVLFLIIMALALANCLLMFVRHSSLWINTTQTGVLINDFWIYAGLLLITMLTTALLILSVFITYNSRVLKNKLDKPVAIRMRHAKLLCSLLRYFIVLMGLCLALETFLFIYSASALSLAENAGGAVELAIVLLRYGLDIVIYPAVIVVYRIMRHYRKMLDALPHTMKKLTV